MAWVMGLIMEVMKDSRQTYKSTDHPSTVRDVGFLLPLRGLGVLIAQFQLLF